MVFKLIVSIVCGIFGVCFIGFNLDNKCDVNLLFSKFEGVSVIYVILFSIILGVLAMLPFILKTSLSDRSEDKQRQKKEVEREVKKARKEDAIRRKKEEMLRRQQERK